MIESLNNDKVKYWSKLNEKKHQKEEGLFLIEGEHLVIEAEKSGNLVEIILLEGETYDYPSKTFVKENVMKKITNLTNAPKIIGVAKKLSEKPIKGNVLILDDISDPGNMGTIIRSSAAFNIDTIILSKGCVSIYNPKVLRATEGLIFQMNIIEKELENAIKELKNEGYKVYGTDVKKGTLVNETSFSSKTAIVMGNEGAGVKEEIKNICDDYLYIKMNEKCESLNVGVASSIILYELSKQNHIK